MFPSPLLPNVILLLYLDVGSSSSSGSYRHPFRGFGFLFDFICETFSSEDGGIRVLDAGIRFLAGTGKISGIGKVPDSVI